MSRDSIHPIRSWIVDFASQPLLSFSSGVFRGVAEIAHLAATFLCGRNSLPDQPARTKARVAHSQRHEDILARKLIKRGAADSANNFAQSDVADVAVNEARARRISQAVP